MRVLPSPGSPVVGFGRTRRRVLSRESSSPSISSWGGRPLLLTPDAEHVVPVSTPGSSRSTSSSISARSVSSGGRQSSQFIGTDHHYTEGIEPGRSLGDGILVHTESHNVRDLSRIVLDGVRRRIGGELDSYKDKTVGILSIDDGQSLSFQVVRWRETELCSREC